MLKRLVEIDTPMVEDIHASMLHTAWEFWPCHSIHTFMISIQPGLGSNWGLVISIQPGKGPESPAIHICFCLNLSCPKIILSWENPTCSLLPMAMNWLYPNHLPMVKFENKFWSPIFTIHQPFMYISIPFLLAKWQSFTRLKQGLLRGWFPLLIMFSCEVTVRSLSFIQNGGFLK